MTVFCAYHVSDPTTRVFVDNSRATGTYQIISFHFICEGECVSIKANALPLCKIDKDNVMHPFERHMPIEVELERYYSLIDWLYGDACDFELKATETDEPLMSAAYRELSEVLYRADEELDKRWSDHRITLLDFIREYTTVVE